MRLTLKPLLAALLLVLGFLVLPAYAINTTAPGQAKKVQVGTVQKVTGNTVVIEPKGQAKKSEVVVTKDTKVVGQDKKTLKVSQIKPKDMIAAISSDSGTATVGGRPVKVFVKDATASAQSKRRAVQGLIQSISGNTITVVHQIHRDRVYTVFFNESTLIKMKDATATGSGQLQPGQRIVAVGDLVPGGILAKRIHVIPGKATGIFKKQPFATPSGGTGTPSGTPPPPATGSGNGTPSATPPPPPPPATSSATP